MNGTFSQPKISIEEYIEEGNGWSVFPMSSPSEVSCHLVFNIIIMFM